MSAASTMLSRKGTHSRVKKCRQPKIHRAPDGWPHVGIQLPLDDTAYEDYKAAREQTAARSKREEDAPEDND